MTSLVLPYTSLVSYLLQLFHISQHLLPLCSHLVGGIFQVSLKTPDQGFLLLEPLLIFCLFLPHFDEEFLFLDIFVLQLEELLLKL